MHTVSRPLYRVRQFLHNLTAQGRPDEEQAARHLLPGPALALFTAMSPPDRCHSLAVCARLQAEGWSERPLLIAALLHDCGKAQASVRPWHRAVWVLAQAWTPRGPQLLQRAAPGSWRWPFRVLAMHAEWGAEQAEQTGCPPQSVLLIRYHQQGGTDLAEPCAAWLRALRAADDQS